MSNPDLFTSLQQIAHALGYVVVRQDTEETSQRVAAVAGRLMHHADPEVREIAASALTQVADRT